MATIAGRLADAHPKSNADYGVEVVSLKDELEQIVEGLTS